MSEAPYPDRLAQTQTRARFARALGPVVRYVPGERLIALVTGCVLAAYVLATLFSPILRGLDTYISFSHLYIWTEALKAGDLLSTWTPVDGNGFGSPVPFFYHKLFNLVGAALALTTGDIVSAYRLAVLVFSAVMFAGVYVCAGRFGAARLSRLVIATAALCAPYALTKLVAGGSVAEYSASALVPFVIALAIDYRTGNAGKWHGVALFALMVLLALAHALIFVAVAGLLMMFAAYQVITSAKGRWSLSIATAATLVLFLVLMYVPFTYWAAYFCPDQARIFGRPADNLLSVATVFWRSPRSAFGWPFFALIACMAVQLRHPKQAAASVAFGLGVLALLLVVLMTRLARPFWLMSDQLDFVQFPWRLLAVATPLCLLGLAGMIERLSPAIRRRVQLGLLVVALVNAGCMLHLFNRDFEPIPDAQLRREVPTTSIIGPDAGGEYYPAAYQAALAKIKVWQTPTTSVLPAQRPLVDGTGCTYATVPRPLHYDALRVAVDCRANGNVRINQFATPFLSSIATDEHGRTIAPFADRPFIEFALPAGRWVVEVRTRTYLELVMMAWRAKLSAHGIGTAS